MAHTIVPFVLSACQPAAAGVYYDGSQKLTECENVFMKPVFYTVQNINGDYAYMVSDTGVDNQVAMFLLPEGTDVGSRLKWENFEWELLE